MYEQGLTTIAVRITGIFMLINISYDATRAILTDIRSSVAQDFAIAYLPTFAIALVSVLFILFPSSISSIIFRDIKPYRENNQINEQNITLMAFAIIGIYFFIIAIENISYELAYYLTSRQLGYGYIFSPDNAGRMVMTAVELAAALWLLFGGRGMAKFMLWARNAMTERKSLAGEPEE